MWKLMGVREGWLLRFNEGRGGGTSDELRRVEG